MFRDSPVSRRTVAAGAAWAVPAVAVAAAAPTLAASTTCTDELQTLTQTFDIGVRHYNDDWEQPMPATAAMSVQVPTCVRPGETVVPMLTATLTAADLESRYSGEGWVGDFEFFYDMMGAVVEPQGHRVRFTELSPYYDSAGHFGFRVSGVGPSVVAADTGDLITVASNGFMLDTFFGDHVNDFYSTWVSGVSPAGAIVVAAV